MSKSILVVEDDAILGDTIVTMLNLLGHEPKLSATYEDACDAINNNAWDVILSDYSLGTGNGIDVMKHAISNNSSAKMIISSGFEAEQFKDELKELETVFWISKPYKIQELVELLK